MWIKILTLYRSIEQCSMKKQITMLDCCESGCHNGSNILLDLILRLGNLVSLIDYSDRRDKPVEQMEQGFQGGTGWSWCWVGKISNQSLWVGIGMWVGGTGRGGRSGAGGGLKTMGTSATCKAVKQSVKLLYLVVVELQYQTLNCTLKQMFRTEGHIIVMI